WNRLPSCPKVTITVARRPSWACSRLLHRHRRGAVATVISSGPGAGCWSAMGGFRDGPQRAGDCAGGGQRVSNSSDALGEGPPVRLVIGVNIVTEVGVAAGHGQPGHLVVPGGQRGDEIAGVQRGGEALEGGGPGVGVVHAVTLI